MRRVLLDANVLTLLIVGLYDPNRVKTHSRTRSLGTEALEALTAELGQFDQIVVTPHVVAETSNLLNRDKSESRVLRGLLSRTCEEWEETHVPLREICEKSSFVTLGVADSALEHLVDDDLPLLTADHELFGRVASAYPNSVLNLRHAASLIRLKRNKA